MYNFFENNKHEVNIGKLKAIVGFHLHIEEDVSHIPLVSSSVLLLTPRPPLYEYTHQFNELLSVKHNTNRRTH